MSSALVVLVQRRTAAAAPAAAAARLRHALCFGRNNSSSSNSLSKTGSSEVVTTAAAEEQELPQRRLDFWRFALSQDRATTRERIVDKYSRHKDVLPLDDNVGHISEDCFIAPSATVIGNVELFDKVSIWYNCVIKGDVNLVRIGAYSNIQDDTVIEESPYPLGHDHDGSTIIGHYVTVGHRCVLRACTIEDECLVGMGSVLEEGTYMEPHSVLGAGSVLTAGTRVRSGELWAGNPAKKVRDLRPEEKEALKKGAEKYRVVSNEHKDVFFLPGHAYQEALAAGYEIGWKERPGQ